MEFKIELRDEAGQLALVSREFANHEINIETMCAIDTNVVIVTDQVTEARIALNALGISYSTTQLLSQSMPDKPGACLLYTSPSPRDRLLSRMPSSA